MFLLLCFLFCQFCGDLVVIGLLKGANNGFCGGLIGRFLAIRKSAFSRAAYSLAENFLSFFLLFILNFVVRQEKKKDRMIELR